MVLLKIVGLYLLIMGLLVLLRRKAIMPAVSDLAKDRGLVLALALVELAAGICVVVLFPVVSLSATGLLSLIGYVMVIESIVYFAFPAKVVRKMVERFNKPNWYVWGGSISVVIGAYLSWVGFGLGM